MQSSREGKCQSTVRWPVEKLSSSRSFDSSVASVWAWSHLYEKPAQVVALKCMNRRVSRSLPSKRKLFTITVPTGNFHLPSSA